MKADRVFDTFTECVEDATKHGYRPPSQRLSLCAANYQPTPKRCLTRMETGAGSSGESFSYCSATIACE
jgi:hypothetical protein